ncbi:MAG: hypothetical protein ACXVHZ_02575, partial [Acidimicrobiia bacterium]
MDFDQDLPNTDRPGPEVQVPPTEPGRFADPEARVGDERHEDRVARINGVLEPRSSSGVRNRA